MLVLFFYTDSNSMDLPKNKKNSNFQRKEFPFWTANDRWTGGWTQHVALILILSSRNRFGYCSSFNYYYLALRPVSISWAELLL